MTLPEHDRVPRFDALFAAHAPDIAAYCRWRSRSSHDAEDALAEVFLTAWRRLDDVPDGDASRVWLYATARRVMANQWRSQRRRASLHERLMSSAEPAIEAWPSDDPAAELVREALGTLAPRDQEVLLLAEWEDLTSAEIAKVLGCTAITARGRLHRARQRFRIAYERLRAGDELDDGPSLAAPHDFRPVRLAEETALDRLRP
jgi:RNA polymerase sigma-70 factor (ECF subfamily)